MVAPRDAQKGVHVTEKIIELNANQAAPEGYIPLDGKIGRDVRPFAVMPSAKCRTCWGKGRVKVVRGETKICECVLRRLDDFLWDKRPPATSTSPKAASGNIAVERIESLEKRVAMLDAQIAKERVELDGAVDGAILALSLAEGVHLGVVAERDAIADRACEMRERITRIQILVERLAGKIAQLASKAADDEETVRAMDAEDVRAAKACVARRTADLEALKARREKTLRPYEREREKLHLRIVRIRARAPKETTTASPA